MIGATLTFLVFGFCCVVSIVRPWIGVVALYGFAILDPGWNWRWSLDREFPFQLYLALFLFAGWIICGFPGLKKIVQNKTGLGFLWFFIFMGWVSHGHAINPETSFYYLYTVFKISLITTLGIALIDSPKKLWILLLVAVFAQGYNAIQINLQYFEDGYSAYARSGWASGTKGDNNGYTIFTIPVLAMAISIGLSDLGAKVRLFSLSIAVLQLHQTLLLESRGGMLAVCLLFFVTAFLAEKNRKNLIGLAAFGIVAVVLAGPPVVREFSSIFAAAEERDNSADSRFKLWKAGAQITLDNPILGVGPWCGEYLVPDYYDGPINASSQRKALHNIFFEVSTGFGIPATLAYLAFFWIPTRSSIRLILGRREIDPWLRAASLAVCAGMPAFFLASMFSSGAMLETGYLLAVLGYAVTNILREPVESLMQPDDVLGLPNAS